VRSTASWLKPGMATFVLPELCPQTRGISLFRHGLSRVTSGLRFPGASPQAVPPGPRPPGAPNHPAPGMGGLRAGDAYGPGIRNVPVRPCPGLVQALPRPCPCLAQALPMPCPCLAQALPRPCPGLVQGGPRARAKGGPHAGDPEPAPGAGFGSGGAISLTAPGERGTHVHHFTRCQHAGRPYEAVP
jgi:hypothetical protein